MARTLAAASSWAHMGLAGPVVWLGWTGSGPQARPKRKGLVLIYYFPNLFLMRKQFQKNLENCFKGTKNTQKIFKIP
jgi:hypothetical protein